MSGVEPLPTAGIPDASDASDAAATTETAGTADRLRGLADLAVVLLGSALVVLTALNQPYNQNEFVQVHAYGHADLETAVTATRQPPLDPFLGVLVERLLGAGHVQQRLVPIGAGIATLALVAVLLRRTGLRWGVTAGLLLLATAPLFLRYSAYARPYALPLALVMACVVAGTLWLDTGHRRWLVGAALTAVLLPLTRVPEPTVFLAAGMLLLLVAGARRRWPRHRAWWLAGALGAGVATAVAAAIPRLLAQGSTKRGGSLVDTDPAAALERVGPALTLLADDVLPLFAQWLPWWPLVLAVAVLVLVLPATRRHLLGGWYWVPLLLGPVAFLVAFHLLVPLGVRDFRVRYAYFLVPPLAVALAWVVHELAKRSRGGAVLAALLTASLVLSQMPTTWGVLTQDQAIDLDGAGELVADHVPDDGLVLFDGPGEAGRWRQPFFGQQRFLPDGPRVETARDLSRGRLPAEDLRGPTYLLLMDASCVSNVECSDRPADVWDGHVPGFHDVARMQHLVLYAPDEPTSGATGVLQAMTALVDGYGPQWAIADAIVAARLLVRRDRTATASELLRRVCDAQPSPGTLRACTREVRKRGLGELLAEPVRGPVVSGQRVRRSRA
jgi:hypothetical protein